MVTGMLDLASDLSSNRVSCICKPSVDRVHERGMAASCSNKFCDCSNHPHYIIKFSYFSSNLVHKLNTTDLTLLKLVQAVKHAIQTARADFGWVYSELLAGNELSSQVPEGLCEFEVLGLRGHVHAASPFEGFAGEGIAEGCL